MLHPKDRVELAHASAFKLGTMHVEPEMRLVRNGRHIVRHRAAGDADARRPLQCGWPYSQP